MTSRVPTFDEIPVRIEIEYPERMSRWLLWFKWLLVIPHVFVLYFYGLAVSVTTFIAWWAILFTGRYPRGLFDFAVGYIRWNLRVAAYYPLLMTDRYPPFGAGDHAVKYEVDYPESLSRGVLFLRLLTLLVLVVAYPLLILVAVLGAVLAGAALALVPWVWLCLLCTGKWPRGLFNFVAAVQGWLQRANAWWFLLRDDWSLFGAQGVKVVEARAAG